MKLRLFMLLPLVGCAADANDVIVTLQPEVISSQDGTLQVHAVVLGDNAPKEAQAVNIAVDYTDRNGTAHMIAPFDGKTDKSGAVDASFMGLSWDGTGTVTVQVGTKGPSGAATFAVLDRTPPKATIMPPASARIGQDTTVSVHVTDEIGISQVWFETSSTAGGNGQRQRSTVVASGSTDATISFDLAIPNVQVGTTFTLYALAEDLSGNQAAAAPVTVTVTQ
jgi:hypothetical protein